MGFLELIKIQSANLENIEVIVKISDNLAKNWLVVSIGKNCFR
jgi:hypothetical protein